MSKRGRRRSSKRRKSSGSKSTSPYNQQENRSCSYKDEMKKDENVLSASENERKCKSEEEEGHANLPPNPNVVYMKTTEDKEKGMKITTSVSVSDMKDSIPKITFQLSHELLSENRSLSETKKRRSFGLKMKLEMKEEAELNKPALKSNFHFIYGEDCKDPPPDVESPEGPSHHSWTSRESHCTNQTQEATSTMWKSPNISQYYSQQHRHHPVVDISPLTMRKHIQRYVDLEKCQNVAPTEQRSAPVSPLRSAMLDELAFSRITQRLFHPATNITSNKTDGGTTFSGAPLFLGSEQHPGNISLVEDHSCPKRKSWKQNKDAEKRGCFFPMKRCNTFPGMSETLGMTRQELVTPYHGCVWSLIMNSLPFNTVRLGNLYQQKIHLSSFGSRKCQCLQSRWSSTSVPEIPKSPQDVRISRLQPCRRQAVSRRPRENVELDRDDPEGKISEEADSGFCQELEGEHLSPEQLPEELHPPQHHSHTPMLCQPVAAGGEQGGASLIPHITAAMDLTSGQVDSICGQHLIPITVEPPHTFPLPTSALSNQWSEETNDPLLDTEKREPEEKHTADIGSAQESTDKLDQKLHKVDETSHQSTPRVSLDNSHHLRPVDSSVSDHWAAKRKLFKENKQWSSAGGSSITSDMTEEQACEDCPPVDMVAQDEDRGFYAETFYSSAWVYQGDDSPGTVPPSLNSRTRAVSIRERTVKISKGTGEYPWGFRIQFSKPIVVTEVDTNGAAEEAGLIVGDSVLAVNGTDVTSIPHSEAANLARQGPDLLTLTIGSDIARYPSSPRPACRGYLYKRTQSGLIKGWRKRWFVLTHECCLCYYRHRRDEGRQRPLHAVRLEGAEVRPDTSLGRPFVFKCFPQAGSRVFFFCTTSSQEMKRWLEAMEKAIRPVTQTHVWEDVTRHNCSLPPLAVKSPECLGLLHKLDRSKDTWVQHYCILKDGCLSFYSGIRATHAQGGIYLQGYMVREQPYGSKKSSIELKPPSDEFKTFYFCAENATENKRWILALKASVKKWLPLHQALQDYMDQPPEETRM